MTFEQLGGAALMLLFLADVFLTVLYARAGTGLLAPYWNRAIWTTLRAASTLFGRRGSVILSFAGPVIIVALIAFWALGLAVGAALIIRPELGSAIRPSSGDTSTDFVTALLVAGNSLSIVGGGDYSPHTTGTRLLYLLNSLIGASVLSLVLSYLVQVYSGLRERNAFALTIDAMTDGTGDAAQMLARLMPGGDSSDATSELGNLIRPLAAIKEAHHFYPLLFYFRFREPLYSVSRFGFVLLDLMTLIESALDHRRYGTLVGSAPLTALRRATLMLFDTLDRNFPTSSHHPEHAAESWQGRRSYVEASRTLARAGIDAQPDGVERYVAERSQWEPLVDRIARTLGLRNDEVDCRRSLKGAATLTSETVRR
jgi:hypothetical protein